MLAAILLSAPLFTVEGVVFHDADRNGVLSPGDPLIEARVTDGEAVVVAQGGRFRFATDRKDATIAITVPAGWKAPDRFYESRTLTEGTNRFAFGLEPDPLTARPDYEFILLGDYQTDPGDEGRSLRAMLERILANRPEAAFISHLGDALGSPDGHSPDLANQEYRNYSGAIRGAAFDGRDLPLYTVSGNHDCTYQLKWWEPAPQHALAVFRKHLGPAYYSFEAGGDHHIVLASFMADDAGRLFDRLDERQLKWLASDLAQTPPGMPLVIHSHSPVQHAENFADFMRIIQGRRVKAAFAGHWHQNRGLNKGTDFWSVITTGSTNSNFRLPTGYRTARSQGAAFEHRFAAFAEPSPLNVLQPPTGASTASETSLIVQYSASLRTDLNLEEHNARIKVEWSADGGEWLRLAPRVDEAETMAYQQTWTARIPAGIRRVRVRATDGRESLSREILLNPAPDRELWSRPEMLTVQPVALGSLILGAAGSEVIAVDAATGEERWRKSLPAPAFAAASDQGMAVFSDAGSRLTAFSEKGEVLWQAEAGESPFGNGGIDLAEGAAVQALWHWPSQRSRLIVLEAATGQELWRKDIPMGSLVMPQISGGQVLAQTDRHVMAWNSRTGAPELDAFLNRTFLMGPVQRVGSTILATQKLSKVFALDAATGAVKHSFGAPLAPWVLPADEERWLVVAREAGLSLYDASIGKRRWRLDRTMEDIPPALRSGSAFSIGADGTLYEVDLATGEVRSMHWVGTPLALAVTSHTEICVTDRAAYLATERGWLAVAHAAR